MKIVIFGLGTVGSSVLQLIQENNKTENKPKIEIVAVFAREIKNKELDLSGIIVSDDLDEIFALDFDLIVEVLGGTQLPLEVHKLALQKGIHVVTANKDLLAIHLNELAQLGNASKAQLKYEASVAGGLPIIQTVQKGLSANKVTKIQAILNGTSNFILTKMALEQMSYDEALVLAQTLGYAEKDPTNDVEGLDSARKLALLSMIAYDAWIDWEQIPTKGISQIDSQDVAILRQLGYEIKLIASSQMTQETIVASVEPMAVSKEQLLANVMNEKNGVYIESEPLESTFYYGPGAGGKQTSSAIVSDIYDVMHSGFSYNFFTQKQMGLNQLEQTRNYYLRLANSDKQVEKLLKSFELQFEQISLLETQVVILKNVLPKTVQRLQSQVQIAAKYQIVSV